MRKAIENGDFLSFMETATAQYERVIRRGGSPQERAALRAALIVGRSITGIGAFA
jgi:hypothetical protein